MEILSRLFLHIETVHLLEKHINYVQTCSSVLSFTIKIQN